MTDKKAPERYCDRESDSMQSLRKVVEGAPTDKRPVKIRGVGMTDKKAPQGFEDWREGKAEPGVALPPDHYRREGWEAGYAAAQAALKEQHERELEAVKKSRDHWRKDAWNLSCKIEKLAAIARELCGVLLNTHDANHVYAKAKLAEIEALLSSDVSRDGGGE